jgi:hypothetical protein
VNDVLADADAVEWAPGGARARVFSGHESFAVRYGWLPKLYEAVTADPHLFSSDERAILALGLGRNMVKSLRFWGDAFGLIELAGRDVAATPFARRLFSHDAGRDPYLEDVESLWRLHWRIAVHAGLGAWVVFFQELQDAEITRERLIELLRARAQTVRGAITLGTAVAHADMLVRTYVSGSTEPGGAQEDGLGSPFQELGLMTAGHSGGKPVLRQTRGPRGELGQGALAFAIHDFWQGVAPRSTTLSLRSLMLDRRAPGVIFRLDENSLVEKLEALCAALPGLVLREDGAGGLHLAGGVGVINELEQLAWC